MRDPITLNIKIDRLAAENADLKRKLKDRDDTITKQAKAIKIANLLPQMPPDKGPPSAPRMTREERIARIAEDLDDKIFMEENLDYWVHHFNEEERFTLRDTILVYTGLKQIAQTAQGNSLIHLQVSEAKMELANLLHDVIEIDLIFRNQKFYNRKSANEESPF